MRRALSLLLVWLIWQHRPLAEVLASGWLGFEGCWKGEFTPDLCCQPPPLGNAVCWDGAFTYDLCCAEPRPAVSAAREAAALADDSEDCWMGVLTPDFCCQPPPLGNAVCWEGGFTYDLCCAEPRPGAGAVRDASLHAGASDADIGARAGAGRSATSMALELTDALASSVGCAHGFYQRFKGRAASWYDQRAASMRLIEDYTALVTHFHHVVRVCPAAALTAMLLKMEARFFSDDGPWSELMGVYVRSEQRALADGLLTRDHHLDGWPLVRGMEKVLALRDLARGGDRRRSGPGASGTDQEALGVVICYCNEDLEWLRLFHEPSSGAPQGSRPAAMVAHVGLYIYHKCGALSRTAREVERSQLEGRWGPLFRRVEVRYVDDVVRADDCSGYMAFISDRFDSLPEFVLLLHADAHEHIIEMGMLTDLAFAASRGFVPAELGFAHLSLNHMRGWGHKKQYEFSATWKHVFRSSLAPSFHDVSAYCCVQMFVRRSRIHLRPRRFYEDALKYFAGSAESNHRLFPVGRVRRRTDTMAAVPCQLNMFFWHVIFGEPLALPRRQHDPNVPLFMKLGAVQSDILDEGW